MSADLNRDSEVGSRVRQRIMFSATVVLALSLVVLVVAWATTTPMQLVPTSGTVSSATQAATARPTRYPLINITRSQYVEAHNRWLASEITEYQISVRRVTMMPCVPDALVTQSGRKVELIEPDKSSYQVPCGTVEDMFYSLDDRLTAVEYLQREGLLSADPKTGSRDLWTYWIVAFSEEYGLPTSITIRPQPDVDVTDQFSDQQVTSFQVIKRQH
jgi:hypothetical protein